MAGNRPGYAARPVRDRFEEKYVAIEPSGCWVWMGQMTTTGYGQMRIGSTVNGSHRDIKAHRLAWELYRGPIPNGMQVLHRCDVPVCVNPDHLFLGTHADNMADMVRKGRARTLGRQGEDHCRARLTEADVRTIRSLAGTTPQREMSARFGVSETHISRIIKLKCWRHLERST